MTKYFLSQFLLFSIIIIGISSCKKESGESPSESAPEAAAFDRKAMLKSIADNVILPSLANTSTIVDRMNSALLAFGINPSEASLGKAEEAFLEALSAWKTAEGFNIGEVQARYLKTKIESTPASAEFIEDFIASDETLNEAFIESKGSSAKGFRAIEYLLFDPQKTEAEILTSFTQGDAGSRRRAYLTACGENLLNQINEMEAVWNGAKDYYTTFINDDGTYVTSSLSMLVNEVTALLQKMSQTKLGKPLGKSNGGNMDAMLLESYLSGNSATDLQQNLFTIRASYFGGQKDDAKAIGMDDYLTHLNITNADAPLTERIRAQFDVCQAALQALETPLRESMDSNAQPAETAYDELRKLLVLFKTELASQMGVTITFSDNDGD